VLAKLKKIPSVYSAHGLYGIASKLTALSPHPQLFFVGGIVLMCVRELKLPSIVGALACHYQIERISSVSLHEAVQCGPAEDCAVLGPEFRRYLERGAVGIAIRSEGKMVAYNWAFQHTYDLKFSNGARLVVQMTPATVFLGNGYIDPAYRMRGLFPLMIRESASAFGEGRCCWSSTDLWNDISLASHRRVGFTRIATVSCATLLGATWFGLEGSDRRGWTLIRGGGLQVSDDDVDLAASRRSGRQPET